jgi:hypothetical protein
VSTNAVHKSHEIYPINMREDTALHRNLGFLAVGVTCAAIVTLSERRSTEARSAFRFVGDFGDGFEPQQTSA